MTKLLLIAFVLHFIADFLLQSREMGKNKSTDFRVLSGHLGIQLVVMWIGLTPFIGFYQAYLFANLNAMVHGIIDWNIWRGYKYAVYRRLKKVVDSDPRTNMEAQIHYFKWWEDHWFYSTIGFDQLLHIATITILIGVCK